MGIENAPLPFRPLTMAPRPKMGALRTCQPSTQVHTAAFRMDLQWMADQVDTGEELCATSILRQTQSRITDMIENAPLPFRPLTMAPRPKMGALRTCQPFTQVHTAAFRMDPQ